MKQKIIKMTQRTYDKNSMDEKAEQTKEEKTQERKLD